MLNIGHLMRAKKKPTGALSLMVIYENRYKPLLIVIAQSRDWTSTTEWKVIQLVTTWRGFNTSQYG